MADDGLEAVWRSPIADLASQLSQPAVVAVAQSFTDHFKAMDALMPKPLIPPGLEQSLALTVFADSFRDHFKAMDALMPKPLIPPGIGELLAKMDRNNPALTAMFKTTEDALALAGSITAVMDRVASPSFGELASLVQSIRYEPSISPAVIANSPQVRTARATMQLVDQLAEYQAGADRAVAAESARADRDEAREAVMLRLTWVNVALAAVSVVAAVVAVVLGVIAVA